jgi:hypothetical protein
VVRDLGDRTLVAGFRRLAVITVVGGVADGIIAVADANPTAAMMMERQLPW